MTSKNGNNSVYLIWNFSIKIICYYHIAQQNKPTLNFESQFAFSLEPKAGRINNYMAMKKKPFAKKNLVLVEALEEDALAQSLHTQM